MSVAYLNGEFLPLSEAKIPVMDRGFLFADGVYEVMPTYNGRIFRIEEHLLRLDNSLSGIYMKNPMSMDEWKNMLEVLVEKNEGKHQSLYLQVTRGVSERDHLFNEDLKPTIFAMSKPLREKTSSPGIAAITREDSRWKHCDLKTIALLPGVLLRNEARSKGATEAILYIDNFITEGAASNVFVIKANVIKTPPKGKHILPGVTRDLVVELMLDNGLDCREEPVTLEELRDADEIWITSSTWEIVPVITLDGRNVGSGQPGPVYAEANRIYQEFKENF
ncbi:MAG: D-amino acid aminotransferase [Gammaproteobacteria bacterium]|nr:D-amino acid aminotransferase [Gammaproteobacteria bacterium]